MSSICPDPAETFKIVSLIMGFKLMNDNLHIMNFELPHYCEIIDLTKHYSNYNKGNHLVSSLNYLMKLSKDVVDEGTFFIRYIFSIKLNN